MRFRKEEFSDVIYGGRLLMNPWMTTVVPFLKLFPKGKLVKLRPSVMRKLDLGQEADAREIGARRLADYGLKQIGIKRGTKAEGLLLLSLLIKQKFGNIITFEEKELTKIIESFPPRESPYLWVRVLRERLKDRMLEIEGNPWIYLARRKWPIEIVLEDKVKSELFYKKGVHRKAGWGFGIASAMLIMIGIGIYLYSGQYTQLVEILFLSGLVGVICVIVQYGQISILKEIEKAIE